jgi:hypothetical protein
MCRIDLHKPVRISLRAKIDQTITRPNSICRYCGAQIGIHYGIRRRPQWRSLQSIEKINSKRAQSPAVILTKIEKKLKDDLEESENIREPENAINEN